MLIASIIVVVYAFLRMLSGDEGESGDKKNVKVLRWTATLICTGVASKTRLSEWDTPKAHRGWVCAKAGVERFPKPPPRFFVLFVFLRKLIDNIGR
jgi:hypothetical protein